MTNILFVCHGNICRSPMAEFVLKDMAEKAHVSDKLYIASAATSTEEIGNPVHYGTTARLRREGISTAGKTAVQMRKADYAKYDYIIGMDKWNIRNIKAICGGDPDNKVMLMMSLTGSQRDVADPWYTGDFEATYKDVYAGCRALMERLGYTVK